jgi:S-formylglutathione hydrolase FrmB
LWLHGFLQDEESFLSSVVGELDKAIVRGQLPPVIVAAPDGSLSGRASYLSAGSFFINSKAGNFEDYTIRDVWGFVVEHFPIRPEREAHVLAGVSMGGFAAYNLGIKYQQMFKVVVGIFPPLNLRWVDCHGRYMSSFDPCCWGWRTQVDRGHEPIGRFYGGLITVRLKKVVDPLYGRGPDAVAAVASENPIEMIDRFGLVDGVLDMYIAYAGRDEFNIDAQVESFLYVARHRGLTVAVGYDPKGRHNLATARRLYPDLLRWLAPRIAPYAPIMNPPCPMPPPMPTDESIPNGEAGMTKAVGAISRG